MRTRSADSKREESDEKCGNSTPAKPGKPATKEPARDDVGWIARNDLPDYRLFRIVLIRLDNAGDGDAITFAELIEAHWRTMRGRYPDGDGIGVARVRIVEPKPLATFRSAR